MIRTDYLKQYCCEDISKIENYQKAKDDKKHMWVCHHRAEILPCGVYSRSTLQKFNLYWKRPASELVLMRDEQHKSLHSSNMAIATRRQRGSKLKGKPRSEETRQKIRKTLLGHTVSEQSRRKMSEAAKKHPNNFLGRHHTKEAKKKLAEANKKRFGKRYFNNGKVQILEFPDKIPAGFVKGKLKKRISK